MNDSDSQQLINYAVIYERVKKMKMEELFSEPYDGDMDEDE